MAAELYQVLLATLQTDPGTRSNAEQVLEASSRSPNFGLFLAQIACSKDAPQPGVRQLAAVVLKKHIKEHWTYESNHFREPPIDEDEKTQVS
jgi:hypothetical protein